MGIGKILSYSVLGVGIVAAAPFTGGGSVFAGATIVGSLTGAGAVTAVVGTTGAVIGKVLSDKEEREKDAVKERIAKLNKKAQKYEEALKKAIEGFKGDKEYFNYIIAASAIGISMANADGKISDEERLELDEFVGGIAGSNYPQTIKDIIETLYKNPPTFKEALKHLEKVNPLNYESIKDMLELVMEADGKKHEKEVVFMNTFKSNIARIKYHHEEDDKENKNLLEIKEKLSVYIA